MPDLQDGESTEMQGSGSKPYILKNTGGVYSCSCPAWRNQSNPIEKRSCTLVNGRSSTLLKIKTFHDAEAVVVGHQAGAGRHLGRLGALLVRLPDGTDFAIGTGFSPDIS